MKTFDLEILTPEKAIFKGKVTSIIVPAYKGYLGVMADHAPFVCSLSIGEVTIHQEQGNTFLALSGGLMEVTPDKTIILADSSEPPESIDVQRAQKAQTNSQEQMKTSQSDDDYDLTYTTFRRAENRLKISTRRRK